MRGRHSVAKTALLAGATLAIACSGPRIAILDLDTSISSQPGGADGSPVKAGTHLRVIDNKDGWLLVEQGSGPDQKTGYVRECFATVVREADLAEKLLDFDRAKALFDKAIATAGRQCAKCSEQCRGVGSAWGSANEGIVNRRCLEACEERCQKRKSKSLSPEQVTEGLSLLELILRDYSETPFKYPAMNEIIRLKAEARDDSPLPALESIRKSCPERFDVSLNTDIYQWASRANRLAEAVPHLTSPAAKEQAWVGSAGIDVLEQPAPTSKKVGSVSYGESVHARETVMGYTRIEGAASKGWVTTNVLVDERPLEISGRYALNRAACHGGTCEPYGSLELRQNGAELAGQIDVDFPPDGKRKLPCRGDVAAGVYYVACGPVKYLRSDGDERAWQVLLAGYQEKGVLHFGIGRSFTDSGGSFESFSHAMNQGDHFDLTIDPSGKSQVRSRELGSAAWVQFNSRIGR